MDIPLREPFVIHWYHRLFAIVLVVLFYALAYNAAFTWLWPHLTAATAISYATLEQYPWLQLYANHLWVIVITLPSIWLLGGRQWLVWSGLTFVNYRRSLSIYATFVLFFTIYTVGFDLLLILLGRPPTPATPLTLLHILGWLGFQLFLSGPAEELLFRGLFQSALRQVWPRHWLWRGLEIPQAGFIVALLFALVHINFTVVPLAITHFDVLQVSGALFFGLCYAIIYHRTGSLLCPILAHSTSNVIALGLPYLISSIHR